MVHSATSALPSGTTSSSNRRRRRCRRFGSRRSGQVVLVVATAVVAVSSALNVQRSSGFCIPAVSSCRRSGGRSLGQQHGGAVHDVPLVPTAVVGQRGGPRALSSSRTVQQRQLLPSSPRHGHRNPPSCGGSHRSLALRSSSSAAQETELGQPKKKSTMDEIRKILPLGLMFFCILFNYTILRDTKDVLLITAPGSGAEVIPFIKTYVNLPAAIGFTAIYTKLCDKLEDSAKVFYTCTIPFLIFFLVFAWLIYPNTSMLHPHDLVDKIASILPGEGFKAPLSIVRNWSYAVFYVMAEMWGSVVASLLFWGFANEITTVDEAKKYYPLFGMGANVSLILSGQYVRWVSNVRASLSPGVDAWGHSLKLLMGAVLGSGACMLAVYSQLQRTIAKTTTSSSNKQPTAAAAAAKKKRPKMGMRESAKFLMSSKYIRDLATLVISYGMCINIVEVTWKSKLKAQFSNPNDYSAFMGNFSSCTGAVTLTMMLLGRSIFQRFGWRTAALVTPTMIGVTGIAFFALNIFAPTFAPLAAALGTTPLMLAVLVGAAQNILSKSSKYSLFDPAKEMAYIPLDQDSKTKGKAAIDVVGNPLGKSGGSLIQQALIFALGSLAAATPYLACILGVLIFFWFKAANSLATQFDEAMRVSPQS